jgi:D-glycero-D-manno-heptose 1,7-bisphosphate phosphatase
MIVQRFSSATPSMGRGPGSGQAESARTNLALLDRDGVINANRDNHVRSWDDFLFLPGALEAISLLSRSGWTTVVVTNQAIINRGHMTSPELGALHHRMAKVIEENGGRLSAVYACPHRPDESCGCRKPEPGLLLAAASDHDARPSRAIMVGDHPTDLEAARRAGSRSILVRSGRYRAAPGDVLPDSCVGIHDDLLAAARWIVGESSQRPLVGAASGGAGRC